MCRALYPGTFDPIHFGHIDIAIRAATIFDDLVIGVYDRPSKSLLFTLEERIELAREALKNVPNIHVLPYGELTAEFARRIGAKVIVRGLRVVSDFEWEYQMSLTNRQVAPEIEFVCLMTRQEHAFLSSSILKEVALLGGDVSQMAPPNVVAALQQKRAELERQRGSVPLVSLRD
ncbi:MAG: pantetheine-phosphate adenylyltransferase [Chloroflexi bacterium]|jgi:pantetheine-phosphate adenylyltransferase|nr:pantetheine-phosphate adenylyltransferase [Chloroflexota bacterium]